MNLDLDLSAVPRFFRGIWTELRQKRLWPVALLLLVAVVAVPLLLSKSASTPPAEPQALLPTPPPARGTSLPTLNVETTPAHSNLTGRGRNPFGSTAGTSSSSSTASSVKTVSTAVSTATSNTSSTVSGAANSTTATGTGGSSTATSTGSSSGSAPASAPPSITPGAKPKPAPSGLKPTQAYDVSLATTNSQGGVNTTDPLPRDSVIPSAQQPLLVELGVAHDGNHVLFAVQPGAVPTGPGTCTPGPIDCEILSLGQHQTEALSVAQGSAGPAQVALFAITSISATNYRSSAAARKVRRASSAVGRTVLAKDTSPALSLFQYEPGLGSVVDLRNLKVADRGGNVRTMAQTTDVLGSNGVPVPPSNPSTGSPTNLGAKAPLQVRMQLLPQALHSVLRSGITVQVLSNGAADGIASVYISRATAKTLHIKVGRSRVVVIGRGTVSQVKDGTVVLHLFLSRSTASKLKQVKHATLNVRLALVGVGGDHLVVAAAGRY
jgi:hypothetical protein